MADLGPAGTPGDKNVTSMCQKVSLQVQKSRRGVGNGGEFTFCDPGTEPAEPTQSTTY